jgi:branched-subunit amino acid ABC-type transport system permease component
MMFAVPLKASPAPSWAGSAVFPARWSDACDRRRGEPVRRLCVDGVQDTFAFAIIIAVLMFRPQGLFTRRIAKKV